MTRWLVVGLTALSSCAPHSRREAQPSYGELVASPPFVATDYVIDVIASGQQPAVLLTIVPAAPNSEPTIRRRFVTTALAASMLNDMAVLASARPESRECTDSTAYLIVVQTGNEARSRVTSSCQPTSRRAASRVHLRARSIFGDAVPASPGWIDPRS